MKKPLFVAFQALVLTGLVAGSVLPLAADAKVVAKKPTKYRMSVSAIPGADEKNFENSASRCVTASMKALNTAAVKQMEDDIKKAGEGHAKAADEYREKVAIVWSAMEQPYCGYGSQGLTAVKRSFTKSIGHIRAEFLEAAKKVE